MMDPRERRVLGALLFLLVACTTALALDLAITGWRWAVAGGMACGPIGSLVVAALMNVGMNSGGRPPDAH